MTTTVHIVVPGFTAITEFVPAHPGQAAITDDCGPCASECCIAACQHRAPSTANMVDIRKRDIEHGWFTPNGGQDLHHVYLDATELAGMSVKETPQGSSLDVVHAALREACLRGNPCVVDLFNAGNLPQNETTVRRHFIAIGGIDTQRGYLIANGDHAPPTFGPVGTYWVTWDALAKAQPVGLLEYHMPAPPPHPLPTPGPAKPIPPTTPDDKLHAALQQIQEIAAAALKG